MTDGSIVHRPPFPEWALGLARAASVRSEDPYVQVGSVVVSYDWTVLGIGYNGLPPKVDMPESWWDDRDGRRPFMIHAEVNALRTVTTTHADGLQIVSTHIPCVTCMSVLASYRVGVVYYSEQLGEAHDQTLIARVAELHGIGLRRIGDRHGEAATG
jgi:dCMP deaminase